MKKAIFFVIILLIFFCFLYYNTGIFGNNIIIKNENKIVDYILNDIKEYEAEVQVTIYSNKTQNTYKMKQIERENYSFLEVLSSGKINGLIIETKDGNLNIQNTELKLDKIYENYDQMMKNSLFLKNFIEEFNNNEGTTYQENNQIIFETKLNSNNKYSTYQILYVDIQTIKPTKMEIKDNNKNTNICIEYNNIEIK